MYAAERRGAQDHDPGPVGRTWTMMPRATSSIAGARVRGDTAATSTALRDADAAEHDRGDDGDGHDRARRIAARDAVPASAR